MTAPVAHVVHRASGRLRLRVPERRGDREWLAAAADRVSEMTGIAAVEIGPETGSLLVHHAIECDPEPALRGLSLWRVEAPARADSRPVERLMAVVSALDGELRELASERIDLRTILLLSLLGLAAIQIWRGQFMAPAASLLWYAIESVNRGRRP